MANPNASKSHWRAPSGKEYRIVDMKQGDTVVIQPTEKDVKAGVPMDPNNCAMANAWKRATDVPDAQFGRSKVYLPMRIEGGEIVAMRGKLHEREKKLIDKFDKTGEFPTEGVRVYGIPDSDTLESQRAKERRFRERWHALRGMQSKKKRKKVNVRSASSTTRTIKK